MREETITSYCNQVNEQQHQQRDRICDRATTVHLRNLVNFSIRITKTIIDQRLRQWLPRRL